MVTREGGRERARTQAWKTMRWPSQLTYFLSGDTADCTRHTMDSHWLRFSESPTNIIRFPRSLSTNSLASNLQQAAAAVYAPCRSIVSTEAYVIRYLGMLQPLGCHRHFWYVSSRRPFFVHVTCDVRNWHSCSLYSG
jgi:hypothetical protein